MTDTKLSLVERLRAAYPKFGNYGMITPGAPINPNGPEAADTIEEYSAKLEEFCLAAECAAGCDEDVAPDIASSEILASLGSPMAVAYDKARALLSRIRGDA